MSTPAPPSLAIIAKRVGERLDLLLTDERTRWVAVDPDLGDPIDEIKRLVLAGGKRLRPAFCTWGYVGAGGEADDDLIVDAGAAFELMHAFALFHDDVMDDALTRRGAPASHVLYRARHEAEGWAGEARRFGDGMAVLIGDLAFVYADRLLADASRDAWAIWNELRIELNAGQVLDILGSVQLDRDEAKAARICRLKSGKYTIERPLHLGAVLAAPDRAAELLPQLSDYGLPLGDAFQMRDDVMGAFGDPALTGKPVGGDLREAKPTPMLACAVAKSSRSQRDVLMRVGSSHLTDEDIAEIQQVIVDTGALADIEARIVSLADSSIAAVRSASILPHAIDELVALAAFVSQRNI